MGYDMHSTEVHTDEGYFRLNIWGMAWMRRLMLEGNPKLPKRLMDKFCWNDGQTVSKPDGQRVAAALLKYLETHPLGTQTPDLPWAPGRPLTSEDVELIQQFIEYNQTKTPYQVF